MFPISSSGTVRRLGRHALTWPGSGHDRRRRAPNSRRAQCRLALNRRRALCWQALPTYRGKVLVKVSPDAAGFVNVRGGELWVWAAHARMCCSGSPAWMHAATEPPAGLSGFSEVAADGGVRIWFRGVGDLLPDVLEVGLRGRRRPRVEAYWDGCLMAMV